VLLSGVQGITDLITTPGLINLDFADVKSVMAGAGSALMGIGSSRGEGRAVQAAGKAINSPLLEASMDGAQGVLLSIAGGSDLGLFEINDAAQLVTDAAHPDANIIFGAVIDDALGEEIRVTVIAAGFDKTLTATASTTSRFAESRLSRLLEEPEPLVVLEPVPAASTRIEDEDDVMPMPSILVEEEDEIFKPAQEGVAFDAEEDLDIPDFLKS